MNVLIYGSGAIGSHIAYILSSRETFVYMYVRKKSKKNFLKKNGIVLTIKDNSKIIKKVVLKKNIIFIDSFDNLGKIKFDFIFLTFKLIEKYKINYNYIKKITGKNTKIILPCTVLPDWWLKKFSDRKIKTIFPLNNIIGMTMWISGMMKKNKVIIRHTQRGYPLKEINSRSKKSCDTLRNLFLKKTKSPKVKNIYSEIYIKVINSFAFNLIAIKYNQNNAKLASNIKALQDIKSIMNEFDNILKKKNLTIPQTVESRIKQTLSSKKHTMSMLFDLNNGKKIELFNQWSSLKQIVSSKNESQIKMSNNIYKRVLKSIH